MLIADDDPAVVRALSVRCKKLGLEVETAENGLQAILKASRNPPRLLILDINMPEADGFRVCEWLLDPQRPPVDVVMLTGRDDSDTLVRCDSFGAFYVPKNHETWDTIKSIMGEILDIDDATLAASSAPRSSFGGEAPPVVREKRNKVLIVEDDADLARALERRLQKCGAETMIASNGIEAYRMAMKELPDAIIADYVMPEGGGHYLLWRLKSTDSTKHIPVIMITGQTFEPGTEHSIGRDVVGPQRRRKILPQAARYRRAVPRAVAAHLDSVRAAHVERGSTRAEPRRSPRLFLAAASIRPPRRLFSRAPAVRSMSFPTLIGRPKR